MAQVLQNNCVLVGKFSLNIKLILIQFVMQCRICPGVTSADNPVEVLNEHLLLLVGRFVPTEVVRVHNKDKPWFDNQLRHALA